MAPILIGISGGSCAGKSTLARLIQRCLDPIPAAIITADRYYRSLDHLPVEKRPLENFDSPDMLDRDLLRAHLTLLKTGRPAGLPVYDFRLHTRSAQTEILDPTPAILIEGIFLLADSELRPLFDLAVFVETPADTRLARRILRDRTERGRTVEETLNRYFTQIRPADRELAGRGRTQADLILNGEDNPEEAAGRTAARIFELLSDGRR